VSIREIRVLSVSGWIRTDSRQRKGWGGETRISRSFTDWQAGLRKSVLIREIRVLSASGWTRTDLRQRKGWGGETRISWSHTDWQSVSGNPCQFVKSVSFPFLAGPGSICVSGKDGEGRHGFHGVTRIGSRDSGNPCQSVKSVSSPFLAGSGSLCVSGKDGEGRHGFHGVSRIGRRTQEIRANP
jgi:hypothetical protein